MRDRDLNSLRNHNAIITTARNSLEPPTFARGLSTEPTPLNSIKALDRLPYTRLAPPRHELQRPIAKFPLSNNRLICYSNKSAAKLCFFITFNRTMPNIKSAIKRVQIAERNRLRNKSYKSAVKTLMKKYFTTVENYAANPTSDELKQEVDKRMSEAYSKIDKAVKHRVIHPNNGSRKKARLAKYLKTSLGTAKVIPDATTASAET